MILPARSIAASDDPDYVTVSGDIGTPEVARKLVQTALDRFGRVDTLINNAGIWRPGPIEDISEELYRRVMSTNLDGMFFATQAAVPAMKKLGGGHIVQVSTSLVEHAVQSIPAVLASLTKGACVAATRGLAMAKGPAISVCRTSALTISSRIACTFRSVDQPTGRGGSSRSARYLRSGKPRIWS